MTARPEIVRAEAEAAAAKARFNDTLGLLKQRVNPRIRAEEAWTDVRSTGAAVGDDALEFAYERPRIVAAAAGLGALIVLRRPLGRLFRRLAFWRRPKWDAAKLPHHPAGKPKRLPHKGGDRP